MKRPTIFRKFCQALGVLLVFNGLRYTWICIAAALSGELAIGWAILFCFINLGAVTGLGLLFVFMDPHLVIQYYHNLHLLVKPANNRRSFADRIGVDEDDD